MGKFKTVKALLLSTLLGLAVASAQAADKVSVHEEQKPGATDFNKQASTTLNKMRLAHQKLRALTKKPAPSDLTKKQQALFQKDLKTLTLMADDLEARMRNLQAKMAKARDLEIRTDFQDAQKKQQSFLKLLSDVSKAHSDEADETVRNMM